MTASHPIFTFQPRPDGATIKATTPTEDEALRLDLVARGYSQGDDRSRHLRIDGTRAGAALRETSWLHARGFSAVMAGFGLTLR